MTELTIQNSSKTPSIRFNGQEGKLEIKGRSIPENSLDFYKPLIDWVEKYVQNPAKSTEFHIQLEYFNTSSSKCLLDLLKRLENIKSEVLVHWYYEQDDEDMLEAGEDYEAIISIPFKMIEIEQL